MDSNNPVCRALFYSRSAPETRGGLGLPLCLGIFCAMGIVQLWIMVSAVSSWSGSIVLALFVSFVGVWIPIPWFLIGHWYLEGTLPWGYLAAWIVAWGPILILRPFKQQI